MLLVLLVGSFLLSRGSIEESEQEAERRAEALAASVLFDQLTTDTVSGDILGPEYRELIIAVQAGILSDDRVAQVRIWKTDGDLIFSTAQRDKITEYVAQDNPQIQQAAEGETNSLVTNTTVAARSGLEGSNEQLFETFMPLHLANELSVSGVVQIDQRYEEIRAEALSVWRPVQIAVAFLLPAAIVLLVLSIRKGDEPEAVTVGAPGRADAEVVVDDRVLRDAEERAQAAERAARDAESRMAGTEKRLREAEKAGTTPSMLSRIEELDLKLRASEAEREQYLGELQLLRTQLGERDAEVATLRKGAVASADSAIAEKAIAEAERLIAASETRAASAEARAADLEAELQAATAAATTAAATSAEGEDAKTKVDLDAAVTERDALTAKVVELETTLSGARATILSKDRELEARAASAQEAAAVEEQIRAAELKASDAHERLLDAQARLEESEAKRASVEGRLPELEAGLAMLAELEGRATRAESALADSSAELQSADAALAELAAELEQAKAAVPTADGPSAAELQARVAELEAARRSDIEELQRAQEALANTQVELTNANRKLKEADGRIRELGSEVAPAAEPERAPVPVPDYVTRETENARREPEYGPREPTAAAQPEQEAPAEVSSFAARLSSLRQEIAAATQPPAEVPAEDQPPAEEEGLSLRERLARAAAARHRGPLS
ncbi:MAG TPA: hypothetical protein VJO36_00190 [Actinomycetota bacterium]|nr:hypothetical protein [Actinomycetota bacterium]